MQGETHFYVGITAGLAAATFITTSDWRIMAACTALGGLGGLAPDWLQINLPGASSQIKGAFGHRGFSHWVWTAGLIAFAAYQVQPWAAWSIMAGWLSHIMLDALSNGVPAFWPFGRLTLAHVRTGSRVDHLIGVLGSLALFALSVWHFRH